MMQGDYNPDDPIPFGIVTELEASGPDPEVAEALSWTRLALYAVVFLLLVVCSPAIVAGAYRIAFFG